jgi:peptidoglycan/LPS O-acetylase OafA/YrhL
MAKIKIRDIEGDADEIKNLFKDLGCDLNSYISTTPIKTKIPTYWLFILAGAFFILTCIIWCDLFNPTWTKVSILGLFLLLGLISFIIHNNHDKWAITAIPIVTGLCLILVCLNIYTPQELAKRLENKAIEKIDGK